MNDFQELRAKYPQYADMTDEQFARALHSRFYADMDFADFSERVGYVPDVATDDVESGPTDQPPFATLPPAVGGLLDALVAMGSGTGIPQLVSGDTRAYLDELKSRAPGATRAAQAVGAGSALGAGGLISPARLPTLPGLLSRFTGSSGLRIASSASPASGALRLARMLAQNKLARGLGFGGSAAAGYEAVRRLTN